MAEIPYNYPTVSSTVIDLYSRCDDQLLPQEGFPAMFRHPAPEIKVRAGELLSVTGDKTFYIEVDDGQGGTTSVPALRIKFAANGTTSTFQICQFYRRKIHVRGTIQVTAVTSDVLDADNNVVLRGGEFHYEFAVIAYDSDRPYCQRRHMLEFDLGETVDDPPVTFVCSARAYYLKEQNYGFGGGIASEAEPEKSGAVLANAQGYASGLTLTTLPDHKGVQLSGKAARPGLYWFRLWMQSAADSPGSGQVAFEGGENSEIFIVSIRPKSPVEGDLVCLLDAPITDTDKNTFQVIEVGEIDDPDASAAEIVNIDPTDENQWSYNSGTWDEPPLWQRSGGGAYGGTGNTHLPGYWSRTHAEDTATETAIYEFRRWYVICRDDDGYWRMYCAWSNYEVIEGVDVGHREWFIVAATPALGLDDETPPKYWSSIKLCAKGSERYTVEGKGVFAWAGTFDYLPPDADENTAPVTLDVFGQEPLHTPRYKGWESYIPGEWQYADNRLLYQHPEYGWVCVPSINTEVTAEYQCSPSRPSKIAVPFAPVRPPQLRGGLALERDLAVAHEDEAALCFSQQGTSRRLTLLANVGKLVSSGVIWWHYPLFRFWNMERMTMTVEATFRVTLEGYPIGGIAQLQEFTRTWEYVGGSSYPTVLNPFQYPYTMNRSRQYRGDPLLTASVSGVYAAVHRVTDIPCYVGSYLAIFDVPSGTATTTASADISGEVGSVYEVDTASDGRYWYAPDDSELDDEGVNKYRYVEGKVFHATECEAKCAVWINMSFGDGCDVSVSPVVRRGDQNRPRRVRVFGAALGASCDFTAKCVGEDGGRHYTSWESWSRSLNRATREMGEKEYVPQPADIHGEPYQTTEHEHAGGAWDTGLVVWNEGEYATNSLTGSYLRRRCEKENDVEVLYSSDTGGAQGNAHYRAYLDAPKTGASGRTTLVEVMPQYPEYPLFVDNRYSSLTNLRTTPPVKLETEGVTAERVYDETYSPKVDDAAEDLPGIPASHDYPGWGHEAYWEESGWTYAYSRTEEAYVTVTIED